MAIDIRTAVFATLEAQMKWMSICRIREGSKLNVTRDIRRQSGIDAETSQYARVKDQP